jgi:hypothetical protein
VRRALLGLVVVLAWAGGCAAGPSEPKRAALGESFTLKAGESAQIEAEALQIGFEDVPTDSRCPTDVQCVWEGDATVRVTAQKASRAGERLELHTSASEQTSVLYEGYGIRLLQLAPYPVSGRTIEQADYEVTLEVTRGSNRSSGSLSR